MHTNACVWAQRMNNARTLYLDCCKWVLASNKTLRSRKVPQMKVHTIIFLLSFPPLSWLLHSAPSSTFRWVLHCEPLFYSFCSGCNCKQLNWPKNPNTSMTSVDMKVIFFSAVCHLYLDHTFHLPFSITLLISREVIILYFEILKFQKQLTWLWST